MFTLPVCRFVTLSFDIGSVRLLVIFLNAEQMLHHQF